MPVPLSATVYGAVLSVLDDLDAKCPGLTKLKRDTAFAHALSNDYVRKSIQLSFEAFFIRTRG